MSKNELKTIIYIIYKWGEVVHGWGEVNRLYGEKWTYMGRNGPGQITCIILYYF